MRAIKTHRSRFWVLVWWVVFQTVLAACTDTSTIPKMAQEAYFTCVTATPVPTEVWVVATSWPEITPSPGVTLTPEYSYEYSTPVPTETPYYRVETFYLHQPVQIDGLVISLEDARKSGPDTYTVQFRVENHVGNDQIIPLSDFVFIRRVITDDGQVLRGRWSAQTNDELTRIENTPLSKDEVRTYSFGMKIPNGRVEEIGMMTYWGSSLEGGVPIWFLPESDPIECLNGYVFWQNGPPPPPTPGIVGGGFAGMSGGAGSGICGWPTSGSLVRGFGCSEFQTGITNPMGCGGATPYFHNGLDIAAPEGTEVVSPINGTVVVGFDNKRGNYITVTNGNESHELLHLSATFVSSGQDVLAGTVVGAVGSTGNSTGAHLHWTYRVGGIATDPMTWGGC